MYNFHIALVTQIITSHKTCGGPSIQSDIL